MKIALERNEELASTETRKKVYLLLFVVSSALYLAALLLCLFATGDQYGPFLYVLLAITIAYLWWAIFYFSAALPAQRKRISFLRDSLECPAEEKVFLYEGPVQEKVEKDGLWTTLCRGSFQEKGEEYDWEFYFPGSAPEWEQGTKIKVLSYQRVVLSYEVLP